MAQIDHAVAAIAAFASGTRVEDIPRDVAREATRRIVDTLGCALGGFDSPPAGIAREVVAGEHGRLAASMLGASESTSVEAAAFANTVMARYLDFNDVMRGDIGGGHPSDMIPAVLALAEGAGVSGARAVLGVVVAYQVAGAFGRAPIRDLGWDYGIFGAIGAAAGAAAVLGLDAAQTANAIALAATPAVPLRVTRHGELSMWKAGAAGAAARAALFAVRLAVAGMSGPARFVEGPHGLFEQVTGHIDLDLEPETAGFRVTASEIKRFPCHGNSQAVLSTLLELRQEHGFTAQDVEAVTIGTYHALWLAAAADPEKWDPKTRETADHSLPYLAAVCLREGDVPLSAFSESAIGDRSLRPIMARISISERDELTALGPRAPRSDIEVRARAGSVWRGTTSRRGAAAAAASSDEAVSAKFLSIARHAQVDGPAAASTLASLWDLWDAPAIGEPMRAWANLAVGEPRPEG